MKKQKKKPSRRELLVAIQELIWIADSDYNSEYQLHPDEVLIRPGLDKYRTLVAELNDKKERV